MSTWGMKPVLFFVCSSFVGAGNSRPPPPPLRWDAGSRDAFVPFEDGSVDAMADAAFGADASGDASAPDAWMPCVTDNDGDGDRTIECGGADCDDADPSRSGLLAEVCGNAIDEDCSGLPDDLSDAVTCDLQVLCRNPDCFCDGGCTLAMCVERMRSGYVDYYHCANPADVTAAYRMACEGVAACVDLVPCVGNILFERPEICLCAPGFPSCSGRCTDVSSDPYSCGACGAACGSRQVCESGSCVRCGGLGEACCFGLASESCDGDLACDTTTFICRMPP